MGKTGSRPQRGAALLLLLLLVLIAGMALLAGRQHGPGFRIESMNSDVRARLHDGQEALLVWANARLTHASLATRTPPGFLPYPDRNGDGDYDGTSDCLSGSGLASNALRVGRLPHRGERVPCEGRDRGRAEVRSTAALTAQRAMAGLDVHEQADEPLWYAASRNVLDDDVLGRYPDVSVSSLMRRATGWLTICAQDGSVLSTDAAFVVIAPGAALSSQSRSGPAPPRNQFLDAFSLSGPPPCNNGLESNADTNTVFVAGSGLGKARFNDELVFVSRNAFVSALAIAQARQLARQLQRAPFPYAAPVGSRDGRCKPQLLSGFLAVRDNAPACGGMLNAPPWLTLAGTDFSNPQYTQIRYVLSPAGDRVSLSFANCAIQFFISREGFSYAPGRC